MLLLLICSFKYYKLRVFRCFFLGFILFFFGFSWRRGKGFFFFLMYGFRIIDVIEYCFFLMLNFLRLFLDLEGGFFFGEFG